MYSVIDFKFIKYIYTLLVSTKRPINFLKKINFLKIRFLSIYIVIIY